MTQNITIHESGLSVQFTILDDGVVELSRFSPCAGSPGGQTGGKESGTDLTNADPGCADPAAPKLPPTPIIELQITGKSTRELHGYKHNSSSASLDLSLIHI